MMLVISLMPLFLLGRLTLGGPRGATKQNVLLLLLLLLIHTWPRLCRAARSTSPPDSGAASGSSLGPECRLWRQSSRPRHGSSPPLAGGRPTASAAAAGRDTALLGNSFTKITHHSFFCFDSSLASQQFRGEVSFFCGAEKI